MRRTLFAMVIALFALTLAGAGFAEEKTVEKSIALAMTFTGDEAAIGDYVHAMMLVNSLRALGGEIELDGDRLRIRLELGPEQLDALRKALSEEYAGFGMLTEPRFNRDYAMRTRERKAGSHERFLLAKKHKMPADGERRKIIIMKRCDIDGGMPQGKRIIIKEGCCKVVVTCPHCGKPVEIDLPMPKMGMPMPSMPPGEHPEMFMFRVHPDGKEFECPMPVMPDMPHPPMFPDGEFAPPYPPMPDMDAMRERMGPMMERMERMRHEFGEVNRRCAELERALHELRVEFNRRPAEQDREFWRAIEELHRMLEDRDRERDREFDELWRALDELYEVLEQLERELE